MIMDVVQEDKLLLPFGHLNGETLITKTHMSQREMGSKVEVRMSAIQKYLHVTNKRAVHLAVVFPIAR